MHTKDKLAEALEAAGLPEMASRAREGYYHDFLSPHPDPALALDGDLVMAGTPAAMAVRARHHNGEFDATIQESDEWAAGSEGQAAFDRLKSEE